MKAILHYENRDADSPGGIWWIGQNENVLSYYTDPDLKARGENRFLRLKPDTDLDAYFEYLDNKMPYADMWVQVEVDDSVSPKDYLKKVQTGQV